MGISSIIFFTLAVLLALGAINRIIDSKPSEGEKSETDIEPMGLWPWLNRP